MVIEIICCFLPYLSFCRSLDTLFHGHRACLCLSRSINEMKRLEEMSNVFQSSGVENHPPEPKTPAEGNEKSKDKEEPWEMVMDKKHFKLWRRPITGTHLYQYRGEPCMPPLTCAHSAQACSAWFLVLLNHSVLAPFILFIFLSQMTSFSYSFLIHVLSALLYCSWDGCRFWSCLWDLSV